MELRPGRADDMEAIIELRRDCYPSSPGPDALRQRYLHNPRFQLEDALWIGEVGGRVVASLLLLPLELYWPGGPQSMLGVAGVAVHPSHRRQGLAEQLLRRALATRPASFSGLYPFRSAFYARLGYAPIARNQHWRVAPESLPRPQDWEPLQSASWQQLASIYHEAESALGRGAACRKEAFWKQLLSDEQLRVHAHPHGYLIYLHHPDRRQPLTSRLEVLECVVRRAEAWPHLVGHLIGLQKQVRSIEWPDCGDSSWPLRWAETVQPWGRELRGENMTVGRTSTGLMLRFLDLPSAWQARCYEPQGRWGVSIEVSDPLGRCQGTFQLDFSDERVEVRGQASGAELHCNVGALTQLWCGAATARELLLWGQLQGPAELWLRLGRACRAEGRPYIHPSDCF